jgi:hypothetical protein
MMYFLKINNNSNNSIQLYNKNKRNTGIKHELQCQPPANTKQMRMNRFLVAKKQIRTLNHHHDTSTLQNNKKNAMKNPLVSCTPSLPVAKIACSSKNPTGQKRIEWDKLTKSIYGIIPSTIVSRRKIYNIYDTLNTNIHL